MGATISPIELFWQRRLKVKPWDRRRRPRRPGASRIPWNETAYIFSRTPSRANQEAVVKDWWVFGGPETATWRLCGTVVSHPHIPAGDEHLRTSQIVRLDRAAGVCETSNTIYRLEGPERVMEPDDPVRQGMKMTLLADAMDRAGRPLSVEDMQKLGRLLDEANLAGFEEVDDGPKA